MTKQRLSKDSKVLRVHKSFRIMLRREAANNDLTILEYTKELANMEAPFNDMLEKPTGKKKKYEFGFN